MSLLRVWPDIAQRLRPEQRQVAEQVLGAPLLTARDGDLAPALAQAGGHAFGFVVVAGIVLKETVLRGRSALELLGPGDVLAPLPTAEQAAPLAASRYLAFGSVSVAALDTRIHKVAARWPQLFLFLHERVAQQTHHASTHLAMLHLPRAEDRIIALFADLSERFGRMTTDGVVIDLPLTHELVGRLTGSRRPTVSLALQEVDDQGLLSRLADGRWRLAVRALPR